MKMNEEEDAEAFDYPRKKKVTINQYCLINKVFHKF